MAGVGFGVTGVGVAPDGVGGTADGFVSLPEAGTAPEVSRLSVLRTIPGMGAC